MTDYILGIETSCDETSVAIVSTKKEILAHQIYSQIETHRVHGGVVPEIAAREHLDRLDDMLKETMTEAKIGYEELSAIAATSGPGLIGGVMVGMMAGKTVAATYNKPFIAVNHLAAHVLTPRLTEKIEFPYLALLVSGGHTQFLLVRGVDDMVELGTTIDDALGEAFDKTAKMMGLPYPGGPYIEQLALKCTNPEAAIKKYPLPRPLHKQKNCNFSFSGLKTAICKYIDACPDGDIKENDAYDLAYAFQHTVVDIVKDRLNNALKTSQNMVAKPLTQMTIVGGVAANRFIFEAIKEVAQSHNIECVTPPLKLCTDNGAMIAWAGIELHQEGIAHPLSFPARPRWPLDKRTEKSA